MFHRIEIKQDQMLWMKWINGNLYKISGGSSRWLITVQFNPLRTMEFEVESSMHGISYHNSKMQDIYNFCLFQENMLKIAHMHNVSIVLGKHTCEFFGHVREIVVKYIYGFIVLKGFTNLWHSDNLKYFASLCPLTWPLQNTVQTLPRLLQTYIIRLFCGCW